MEAELEHSSISALWMCIITACHGQEVVSNLNNTAVLVGNDVTLNCTLHNINSSGQLLIERGGLKMNVDKMESCSVEHDRKGSIGTTSLFCPVTKSTDAGRYYCIHPETLQTASAELIVIDAEPRCSTSYTADSHFITFACDLVFSGGWAPAARWQQLTDNGESVGDLVTIMDMLSTNFTPNRQIRFELPVNLTIATIGAKFRCIIYFDSSQRPSSVSAINVPSYEYVWTSETVRTLPVPVTSISPHQSSKQSGVYFRSTISRLSPAIMYAIVVCSVVGLILSSYGVGLLLLYFHPNCTCHETNKSIQKTVPTQSLDRNPQRQHSEPLNYEALDDTNRESNYQTPVDYEVLSYDRSATIYHNVKNSSTRVH